MDAKPEEEKKTSEAPEEEPFDAEAYKKKCDK